MLMFKSVATAPYLAALLASNAIGLELVTDTDNDQLSQTTIHPPCPNPPAGHICSPKDHRVRLPGRLRKLSDGAANLYLSRTATNREAGSPARTKFPAEDAPETDLRPLFLPQQKKMGIRRLYSSKTVGRAKLAPVNASRMNSGLQHLRSASQSSKASSLYDPPSPVATHFPQSPDDPPIERLEEPSSTCLRRSIVVEQTRPRTEPSPGSKVAIQPLKHKREPAKTFALPESPQPLKLVDVATSSIRTPAAQRGPSKSSPQSVQATKGHNRNESLNSIWSFGAASSADEHSPPLNKRKPLQSQTRPPMPEFSPAAASRTTSISNGSPQLNNRPQTVALMRESSSSPARHSALSRTTADMNMKRHRSLPIAPRLFSEVSESWYEDFGELSLNVPQSIRESQATLKSHLWHFRQFADLVKDLKLRRQDRMASQKKDISIHAWNEVDAIIAIASHGDDSEPDEEIQYRGAHDDTISRILGRARDDKGKVRLDEEILASLIAKAETLLNELDEVCVREIRA